MQGWYISRFPAKTRISHYATGFGDNSLEKPESDYAKIIVEINLERNAWGLFFKLFLGMYVAFAITFVTFWIDPEHVESRLALPVGGLYTIVFSAIALQYEDDGKMKMGKKTDRIVRTTLGLSYVLLNVGIVLYAIYM